VDRLFRLLWSVVFNIELRAQGVQCADFVTLRGMRPWVRNAGTTRIGKNFRVLGRVIRSQFGTSASGTLVIGRDVGFNEGVTIFAHSSITIGDNVSIADHASLQDTDYHPLVPGGEVRTAPIVIERNVWIGRNAIVLPGVTIGQNAVVGSGAVVTRDVPPNTVAAGNPARVIRELDIPDPDTFVRRPKT
jgi:acetyltransferase-like isoleucine patch superfamily enzyme